VNVEAWEVMPESEERRNLDWDNGRQGGILRLPYEGGCHGLVFQLRSVTAYTDMAMTKLLGDANVKVTSQVELLPHGFRSSFRDWASERGYPRDLAEKALAHMIKNQTEAAYHRTDLLEQRREMMDAWERHCLDS
jgi:integrase